MTFKLGFPIWSDAGTATGGSWTIPPSNLLTRYISQVARSADATLSSAQFVVDLGAARRVELMSLHNHNLSLAAQVRLSTVEPTGHAPAVGTRAGSALYADSAGTLQTAGTNVIRHAHYVGAVVTTKLEMARTNSVRDSQEYGTIEWGDTDTTVTNNSIAAPDGTTTAALLTEGVAGTANADQYHVVGAATATISRYIKRGNHDWVQVGGYIDANSYFAWFNLATGAVGGTAVAGTGVVVRHYIEALPSGWYRCVVVGTVPDAAEIISRSRSATADESTTAVDNGTRYEWGAQTEAGLFATSYVVTGAAAASRAVDAYENTFPFSWPEILTAGGMSLRCKAYQAGTSLLADARYIQIGDSAANGRYLHIRTGAGPNPTIELGNGTTTVSVSCTVNPALGDLVEHIADVETRDNAGTKEARVRLLQYIAGVASGSSAWSGWIAITANIADGWQGSQKVYLNSANAAANVGSNNFVTVDTALGLESIAFDAAVSPSNLLDDLESWAKVETGAWADAYPDIYASGDIVDGTTVATLKPRAEDIGVSFTPDYFHVLPTPLSARYWQVEIDDTANVDGYVQAGRVVLAPLWTPPHGMSVGASYELDDNTQETRLRSGGYAYDSQPGGRVTDFEISLMTVERAMLLADLRRRITPGKQFVLLDDQWGVLHRHRTSFLATLVETIPLNAVASLYLSAPLKAREEI